MSRILIAAVLTTAATLVGSAQDSADLPHALRQVLEAERAFAARALAVGWKEAFLEFLAEDAVGFAGGAVGLAKTQIRAEPDPPPEHRLIWEARYGDAAASGDLGFVTGPARSLASPEAQPRHLTYTSIWKRQRDATLKVVLNVGTATPREPPFGPGFTRVEGISRFTDYDETTPPLAAADGVLNSALRTSQAAAYRGRVAPAARFYRPNAMPVAGERNVSRWLSGQRPYAAIDTRYSESARSGDLGYTWGTYVTGSRQTRTEGFYVRVWVRERNGQWNVALDILQPQ